MKTIVASAFLGMFCTIAAVPAQAFCTGSSVSAFGAKGDGASDDTAAIQSAISAAASAGGGSVVFNAARYFTTGTLAVPAGVVLCGAIEGPFDVSVTNPAATTIAPTLLVTNTGAPFITLNGLGAGVTDLLFHYPNQVGPSAATPAVYPYTIVASSPGTKVLRCTVSNAYNFLDIESGRVLAQDLFIGAFHVGVNIDHARDHVTLRHLLHTVYWDVMQNINPPSNIDNWVLSHSIALVVNRVDGLEVHDFDVFFRFTGMLLTDSPDATQSPRCGYGTISDVDLDSMQNGVLVTASNASGYEFTNLIVGAAFGSGQTVVQLRSGGSLPPDVLINGGSQAGSWALGAFPTPGAGHLSVVNILGYNLP
jgi:hypothetical protein